ncbi:HAMP domain-containing sensor histidine kinase [Soonwooa sp.]|uniref:sensor histidine kinase n=1 Tax=Soonwooa sp. TaxID=1938592 RepID=UPI00289CB782|nr:HAMP domain-containing sensor histidine kinase [Soonwooa sp.]
MSLSNYKGYSLRNRIFVGFLIVCLLSTIGSAVLSYVVLRDNAMTQSKVDKQSKSEALMSSLDYALSHTEVFEKDLPEVLGNKIYEIADINKHDIIVYDLKGDYLLSNKDPKLITQKHMPTDILDKLRKDGLQYDKTEYDPKLKADVTSSYMVLKNNMLANIGYVYFPLYHNEDVYLQVFNRYLGLIILINILILLVGVWISWVTSNNLTKKITRFSSIINSINLFDDNIRPIRYYQNDELNGLVKAYNKLISEIQDQREKLRYKASEEAWREMAKQVAHEVKNPLTPMKLTIQNFERRFDPEDPEVTNKVKKMSKVIVEQIDLISEVASAFSEFAKLPQRNDVIFDVVEETKSVANVFGANNIYIHSNKDVINVNMDKIYLTRILTNLISNSIQAQDSSRPMLINVDIENIHKKLRISVEDNGFGIPDEKLMKIFEPNFTTKSSGMGLGLTMVRKMIEDYGGEISVKSEVGKGTIFTIMLPTNM